MVMKELLPMMVIMVMVIYPLSTAAGELTAGDFDDNLNYGYFLDYVEKMQQSDESQTLPFVYAADRVTFRITDANGTGVSNAFVSIRVEESESPFLETYAGTDGVFRFFPTIDGAGNATRFSIKISSPDRETSSVNVSLDLKNMSEERIVDVVLKDYESTLPNSMDLMFVLDTTGSMQDELRYLKSEFKGIISNISENYPGVSIRFGLVVYRDQGDEYVVRAYDFTDSLEVMQQQLDDQKAQGGGDYPEAMDQALETAVNYQWRGGNTVRLLFLVADAPPHVNKLQDTLDEVSVARQMGIHIHSLAASGVADTAEYIMRIAACLTNGRYFFLTDDSGIGNPHAEPHIPAYVVTTLDNQLIRVVTSELAGERIEPTENDIIRRVGHLENGVVIPPSGEKEEKNETDEDDGNATADGDEESEDSDRYDGESDSSDLLVGFYDDGKAFLGPPHISSEEIEGGEEGSKDLVIGLDDDDTAFLGLPYIPSDETDGSEGDEDRDYYDGEPSSRDLVVEGYDDDKAISGTPSPEATGVGRSESLPAFELGMSLIAIGATLLISRKRKRD